MLPKNRNESCCINESPLLEVSPCSSIEICYLNNMRDRLFFNQQTYFRDSASKHF